MLSDFQNTKLTSKGVESRTSGGVAAVPNPKRVAAGRLNREKRGALTPEGRERLRQAAIQHQPWRFATGPTTVAGKTRVAANGKSRQSGPKSVREVRDELVGIRDLLREMQSARREVGSF